MSWIRSTSGWLCWTLRQTTPGSALVQPLTAAPDMDGWAITERLLADLAPLADRIWLVVDDVHELGSGCCGSWSCW
jgi:LuxR family transcriptional regulator, maltose regulon positive regulatory protein